MSTRTDYQTAVESCVLESLSEGSKSLRQIARDCRGAYPALVRDILHELEQSGAVAMAPSADYVARSRDNTPASIVASLESNPALASWYFTAGACRTLAEMRDWSGLRLGFLGAPRLYEWFAKADIGCSRTVLDLDDTVLQRLTELATYTNDRLVRYDVAHDIPEELRGSVDVVFFDPPWYIEHYFVWLRRASMLGQGGTVIFALFPELTRPSASQERLKLLGALDSVVEWRWLLQHFVDYEVPTFEAAELTACGLSPLGAWKVADIVVAKLANDAESRLDSAWQLSPQPWIEVDVGGIRFFIDPSHTYQDRRLLFLTDGWSAVLNSPSRRDPQRAAANVLTSRGHAALTSRPANLITVLRALAERASADEGLEAALLRLDIDEESVALLRYIMRS